MSDPIEPTIADQYFICNHEYGVAICRQCEHGVKPHDIVRHLTSAKGIHRISRDIAQQVLDIIENADEWDSVSNDNPILPISVEYPIPGLTVYEDGLQCTMCHEVFRSTGTIRVHWSKEHRFSAYGHGGKPRPSEAAAGQEKREQAMQRVICQRFFRSKFGSHYIHVRQPGPTYEPAVPPPEASRVAQAIDEMEAIFSQQRQQPTIIQAGEIDEANPWLDRTGWARYLHGQTPKALRICIETPAEDAEGPEATARVIWDAILGVASKSQSITKQTGHLLRIEAARTDMQSIPSKPLQAYMHEHAELERHVEPYQRVLMFFARTQVPHEWESPAYRFNRRQRVAWDALWRAAQYPAGRPVQNPIDGGDDQPHRLEPVEARCMDFVIELLNQRIQSSEYECAFVCALAVLGVSDHEGGRPWKDPHSYPPILSSMIKISRFVIVHKAYLLDPDARELIQGTQNQCDGEWKGPSPMEDPEYIFADEGYSSSPPPTPPPHTPSTPILSSSPAFDSLPARSSIPARSRSPAVAFTQQARQGHKTFREWIRIMTSAFMVHGTASPMEWMLDLRRYGLKVHYNTPSDGHISWEGHDQLSYKAMRFTMGAFRGFIHGLTASARQLMVDHVLMCPPDRIPVIPWDRMADDFNQPKAGWSFLQDPRTSWPVHGAQWMSDRVRTERPLQQLFIHADEGRCSIDGIQRFFGFVADFKEKLAVLVHITSGQPARGPELLSIRHRNTAAGGQRNVFIEDGLVALVTRYHKGFYASGDAKVIHRYVPRAVGELIVWYIWLVVPFVEQL